MLLEHNHAHLHTVCSYFCATMAELSGWDGDQKASKAEVLTVWPCKLSERKFADP